MSLCIFLRNGPSTRARSHHILSQTGLLSLPLLCECKGADQALKRLKLTFFEEQNLKESDLRLLWGMCPHSEMICLKGGTPVSQLLCLLQTPRSVTASMSDLSPLPPLMLPAVTSHASCCFSHIQTLAGPGWEAVLGTCGLQPAMSLSFDLISASSKNSGSSPLASSLLLLPAVSCRNVPSFSAPFNLPVPSACLLLCRVAMLLIPPTYQLVTVKASTHPSPCP